MIKTSGSTDLISGQGTNGEGNGNPLQYSCLENPVDRGAWWAAVHRFEQSRTRLKRFTMHACIGEGNGNPLQRSCLENPRDTGAWWAAVYGVTQSQTWLKRLSSSSSSSSKELRFWVLWGVAKQTNKQKTLNNNHQRKIQCIINTLGWEKEIWACTWVFYQVQRP